MLALATLPLPWVLLVVGPSVAASHLLQRRSLRQVAVQRLLRHAGGGRGRSGPAPARGPRRRARARTAGGAARGLGHLQRRAHAAGQPGRVASPRTPPAATILARSAVVTALAFLGNLSTALVALLVSSAARPAARTAPGGDRALRSATAPTCGRSQERDVWRQLEVASRELNRLEEREVAEAALRRARELFRCDDVELRAGPGGAHTRTDLPAGRRPAGRRRPAPAGGEGGRTRWVELDEDGEEPVVTTCLASPLGVAGRAASARCGCCSTAWSRLSAARAAGAVDLRPRREHHRCRTPGCTRTCAPRPPGTPTRRATTR